MTRSSLDNIPEFAPPPGFQVRWYQPGDEAHWLRIHLVADPLNRITPELFEQQFAVRTVRACRPALSDESPNGLKSALRDLCERQCYLLAPTGEVIGTGTAWFSDHFEGGRWGRVHWMAILPEFQGRGLGKALLSVICRRLRQLQHERAFLTTSTARLPAIKLYRKFGFEPLIRSAEDENLWRAMLRLAHR